MASPEENPEVPPTYTGCRKCSCPRPSLASATLQRTMHSLLAMYSRRSRTVFTEDQLKILFKAFKKNPYLDYTIRQELALELDLEESVVQNWFKNRRSKYRVERRSDSEKDLEASPDQDHDVEIPGRQHGQHRIIYTSSQLRTLISAFESNPYPDVGTREQLAKEVGVSELRIQIWFKNQRSKFCIRRKKEPGEPLELKQDQEQDL